MKNSLIAFIALSLGFSPVCPAADRPVPPGVGKDWPGRRAKIEKEWLKLLGDFPKEIPELKREVKKVAYDEKHGIARYHVSFQAEPDDRVTAWLLVPDEVVGKFDQTGEKTPAILCIHSTTWGSGKDQVVGLSGRRKVDPPRDPEVGAAYGLNLARHGYVVLAIDLITDGERIEPKRRVMDTRVFYEKHPEWSIVGKNIWDSMRSVDFLETLEYVDRDQIGVTGWSLGGHSAIFAAAFDQRFAAVISNGGVLDWWRDVSAWSREPKPDWRPWEEGVDAPTNSEKLEKRFGFKTNSGPYIYIKRFREYIDNPDKPLPVDFDDLMAMVAPRAQLIISSEHEFARHKFFEKAQNTLDVYIHWEDTEGMPSAIKSRIARNGWDRTLDYYGDQYNMSAEKLEKDIGNLGAGDAFSWFSFPGGHAWPGVARRMSFAWFDRWLGRTMY